MTTLDLKSKALFRVIGNAETPIDSIGVANNEELKFYNVDGMYARCKNKDGDWVYIKAWSEVEPILENNQTKHDYNGKIS